MAQEPRKLCALRLPRRVAPAAGPCKPGLQRPCLHSEVVSALIADTCLDLAACSHRGPLCTYAQLKKRAAEAVCKRDMRVTRSSNKSSVYCLWSILGQPELYPNTCQQYLVGTLSAGQHKFLCKVK